MRRTTRSGVGPAGLNLPTPTYEMPPLSYTGSVDPGHLRISHTVDRIGESPRHLPQTIAHEAGTTLSLKAVSAGRMKALQVPSHRDLSSLRQAAKTCLNLEPLQNVSGVLGFPCSTHCFVVSQR